MSRGRRQSHNAKSCARTRHAQPTNVHTEITMRYGDRRGTTRSAVKRITVSDGGTENASETAREVDGAPGSCSNHTTARARRANSAGPGPAYDAEAGGIMKAVRGPVTLP